MLLWESILIQERGGFSILREKPLNPKPEERPGGPWQRIYNQFPKEVLIAGFFLKLKVHFGVPIPRMNSMLSGYINNGEAPELFRV